MRVPDRAPGASAAGRSAEGPIDRTAAKRAAQRQACAGGRFA